MNRRCFLLTLPVLAIAIKAEPWVDNRARMYARILQSSVDALIHSNVKMANVKRMAALGVQEPLGEMEHRARIELERFIYNSETFPRLIKLEGLDYHIQTDRCFSGMDRTRWGG